MRKKTKFLALRISIVAAFSLLSVRLWYVQVVQNSYYTAQADTSKIRLIPAQALRGIIYDRNGQQLVYNAPDWVVEIVPNGVPQSRAQGIYARLAALFHNHPTAKQIHDTVVANLWRPYTPVPIKQHVPQRLAMIVKQMHSVLPGVQANPATVRRYVLDPTLSLAHVLGYASEISQQEYLTHSKAYPAENVGTLDLAGRTGIENSLDAYLHGINDTEEVEVDAGERPIRVVRRGNPVPGDSVYLTIDASLQKQVATDLAAGLKQLNLRQGVAIVEDVHSGAIRALVSLPSYNDNWFSGGISFKRFDALNNDPGHPLIDEAIGGSFPPGSTYKIITAAAALGTGVVNANTTVDDTGYIKLCSVYDPTACQIFNGWKPGGLGVMNVTSAIAESSDIYFYTVAGGNPNVGNVPHVGANRLADYARLLGLGDTTGIELPNEAPGFVPSEYWYDHQLPVGDFRKPDPSFSWHIGDTYNMAIGQGYNLATPLQIVNVAATVANGGTLYRPRIVEKIVGRVVPRKGALKRVQVLQPFVPTPLRTHVIPATNLTLIQQGLHESVTLPGWTGTSYYVKDPRIDAAGKTGTAETGAGRPPDAWWVGYAPFKNPQVAVVVMVPNAGAEGAYVSAPIAHKIFEDYFHLKPTLEPPATSSWVQEVQQILVGGAGGSQ